MRNPLQSNSNGRPRPSIGILVASVASIALFSACAAKHETVVSTHTTRVQEQTLTAPKMVDISIVNLHDAPSADPAMERVVGTIVNDGDRPVSRISIRVDALDGRGTVIKSVTTPPLTQTIAANGGKATFEASMPRGEQEIAGYHAVAIAR